MYTCEEETIYGFPIFGKIVVLPLSAAKEFTCDKPWAAISITTTDEWPKLNKCQQVDLLQLSFADLDEITPSVAQNYPHLVDKLFEESHAHQILDFVKKNWDKIDTLLIHCYAGASRSPGVGAAIAKILYGDDMEFFRRFRPNMRVYRTILNVAFERGLIGQNNPTTPPPIDISGPLFGDVRLDC